MEKPTNTAEQQKWKFAFEPNVEQTLQSMNNTRENLSILTRRNK